MKKHDPSKPKCTERVWDGRMTWGCARYAQPGTTTCKQHSPEEVTKRKAAIDARWEAKWKKDHDRYAAQEERQRRAEAYPELISLLQLAAHEGEEWNASRAQLLSELGENPDG